MSDLTVSDLITTGNTRRSLVNDFVILFNKYRRDFGIKDVEVGAAFVANVEVETMFFAAKEENLNYSASGIQRVWPKVGTEEAKALAHNPEALAERVYGGRLGNIEPGDGYNYRGRGGFMLTGRANYSRYLKFVRERYGLIAPPEELCYSLHFTLSALWFWSTNNLTEVYQKEGFEEVVRYITGSRRDAERRKKYFNMILTNWKSHERREECESL